MGKILTGTASWSDSGFVADGYPHGLPARERRGPYAEYFNWVELNSTWYSLPESRTIERWRGQTPDGFTCDVKRHRFLSRQGLAYA